MPSLSNHPTAWEPTPWGGFPAWDDLFDDDNEIIVDEATACSLENPAGCDACQ